MGHLHVIKQLQAVHPSRRMSHCVENNGEDMIRVSCRITVIYQVIIALTTVRICGRSLLYG